MGTHEHNERKKKLIYIYIYFRIFKTIIEYLSLKFKIFINYLVNVDLAQVLQYICVNRKPSNKVFVGS